MKQYLEAEIQFVLDRISPEDTVVELGCGYGRVLTRLAQKARCAFGIDSSHESLLLAEEVMREAASSRPLPPRSASSGPVPANAMSPRLTTSHSPAVRPTSSSPASCHLVAMDAAALAFRDGQFDVVVAIQNGISAFHIDQRILIEEAVRVTRSGGRVLFSSYSERFWDDRLEWFKAQAAHGLMGEIDYSRTGNGVIVCKDGLVGNTVTPDKFRNLTSGCAGAVHIQEVDGSSMFCEIVVA
ncbi:MAG: class I SAM-dependent methyltransferase [Candidatus Eisenbacteria bacterium]